MTCERLVRQQPAEEGDAVRHNVETVTASSPAEGHLLRGHNGIPCRIMTSHQTVTFSFWVFLLALGICIITKGANKNTKKNKRCIIYIIYIISCNIISLYLIYHFIYHLNIISQHCQISKALWTSSPSLALHSEGRCGRLIRAPDPERSWKSHQESRWILNLPGISINWYGWLMD